MRACLAASVLALVAACSEEPAAPAAWPLVQGFHFRPDGVDRDSACRNEEHLARWSYRDLAKTKIRVDGSETQTCVIPVEYRREQFVLQSVSCRRSDGASQPIHVDVGAATGPGGAVVTLSLPGTPGVMVERSFGAGLVVWSDLEAFTVGGQGWCQIAGYYIDRSAPAFGPVRMQTEQRIER